MEIRPARRLGLILGDQLDHTSPLFDRLEKQKDALWMAENEEEATHVWCHKLRVAFFLSAMRHHREWLERRGWKLIAVQALDEDTAPIESLEGFVRQITGWREFIRRIHWAEMPRYRDLIHLGAYRYLPSFFWDGRTVMRYLQESMHHVLAHGYSHHIHRLMVLGLFSLLYGAHPLNFHRWHMGMYLDATDWVSLPNALGMSQYGDGGIGTKPLHECKLH
jgi:deoxyribodipyrimidine photolyase-like uncharacterized protein